MVVADADGDPENWSIEDLRFWLVEKAGASYSEVQGTPRPQLLARVRATLEELYSSFEPQYIRSVTSNVQLSTLTQWAPGIRKPATNPFQQLLGDQVLLQGTPMEQDIGTCYGVHEKIASLGSQLAWGAHPLDDYRQNLLVLAKGIDSGQAASFIAQVRFCLPYIVLRRMHGSCFSLPLGM